VGADDGLGVMTFTDGDLIVMRKFCKAKVPFNLKIQALLFRLGAAEKVIRESFQPDGKAYIGFDSWHEAYKAWRKAAGK
jgi:hypothetical protein